MIFNKCSKLILQCVKEYKYLGLMINCGGNFSSAMTDLFSRGQKALFKVKSIFKNGYPSISTFLKTFDHTVKPVLLYSSEIWGMFDVTSRITRSKNNVIFTVFQNSKIDKINTQFNKYVLGVGKKASNWAVIGELGRYPLYIDIIIRERPFNLKGGVMVFF